MTVLLEQFLTHGTRVMGAMVGQDGADTTGVAVNAQWIAANGFEFEWFTETGCLRITQLLDCFEWIALTRTETRTR